jgi:hypothetical protein
MEVEEKAFCAQSTEKDPRCTTDGAACDGNQRIFCQKGYLTGEQSCHVCSSDEGVISCGGVLRAPCTGDADCLPELYCETGLPESICLEVTLCREDFQCEDDEFCSNYRGQKQCMKK